ncbi:hypothetical protein H6G89_22335 [Oscillatoria sp. FACHB-1407]|uniref:hypothetical protein n=1 Tax=Oscillatoria sp. FACHB-1407 TaxID=2692847 RepID=UPI001688727D|nr:hypothetical protein [Oscillatoria sp. FACHB-1407]MBD2463743.1 hypothetical protein [Oscillatoria sp. FACHB-1407]
MEHLIFWILGFGTLWAGLNLFNDEAVLIVSAIIGSILVLIGLISAPLQLQIGIEVGLILALFNICMQCIKRGDRS